jgi:hypothetical protein
MIPGKNRQEPGAKNISLMRGDAASVCQRGDLNPLLVHPGGSKKLGKECQLRI